jgi:DNA polymerase V
MQYIGLIDCNNFFVSCERLFRPDLRTVPVIVLSSNDGCVVARSKEIKDMGIPMGVPYFQIKDSLKDTGTVCFSSHFALYRDISQRVFTVVRAQFNHVEQYSIDEAFFTFEAASVAAAEAQLKTLKASVEQIVGIPVTVGAAASKTQAKVANAYAKKRTGTHVVCPGTFSDQFGGTDISEVWGVGGRLARRYREAQISTIHDLLRTPTARIATLFGVGGTRLQAELAGTVAFPVQASVKVPKSIMSTRSFATKTNEKSVLRDALAHHVRTVTEDARSQALLITAITVVLYTARHGDYVLRGGTASRQLVAPSAATNYCLIQALTLLDTLHEAGVPYTKVGFIATGLMPASYVMKSLWGVGDDATPAVLDTLVDGLNSRFGRDSVRIGQFVKTPSWQMKQQLLSPAYTTSWDQLKVVKTQTGKDTCT